MELIRYNYAPGEILALCNAAIRKADERLKTLSTMQGFAPLDNFEEIMTDFADSFEPAIFMMNVHTDARIRDDAKQARELIEKYIVELFTRRALYDTLASAAKHAITHVQQRLAEKTLRDFRRSGMDKDEQTIAEVRGCNDRLAELKSQFSANLNANNDYILITEEELAGLPNGFIERLERTPQGIKVKTNAADVVPFMTNCKSAAARRRMLEKYENKEAQKNTALLIEALGLRKKIAQLLGYQHWGDYSTEVKMSKNAAAVKGFLEELKAKLSPLHKRDLALLQSYKRKETDDPLHPWDLSYYADKARKDLHSIDDEELRQYFPADHAVQQMLHIYSSVLSVDFHEIPVTAWAPEVKLFEIKDKHGELLAYFYADFYPREGKYSHFAAFNLRDARLVNGKRVLPIAAMVCNFTPASEATPSLLSHDEMETLFHEFGHIMHTALSQAPYASLSGFKVAWDFVEAPSQMLENWMWQPSVLKQVSNHYKTGKPLPDELIAKLIGSRAFNEGYAWMRQIFFSSYDMRMHTEDRLDPITTYRQMYREMMGIDPLPTTHWPAGWGHIMGGYEAGYYTYTWSRVFAQDMFTRFEHEPLSPRIGMLYRQHILEPGDLRDANILLEEFLGRKPGNEAFLRLIGA